MPQSCSREQTPMDRIDSIFLGLELVVLWSLMIFTFVVLFTVSCSIMFAVAEHVQGPVV